MKKLNRKGFTLVELLAVIIILAIVVGISIPAITSVINGSKNNALGVAVESAADYLKDQYAIYNIDTGTSSSNFGTKFMANGKLGKAQTITDSQTITELGFKSDNVKTIIACVNPDGTVFVEVKEIQSTSEYFTTEHWEVTGTGKNASATAKDGAKNKVGTSCTNDTVTP